MIRLVKDLTNEEILDYLGEDKCDYCPYNEIEGKYGSYKCPRNVCCYGGDPIFPACVDDEDVDIEIAREYRRNFGNERVDM